MDMHHDSFKSPVNSSSSGSSRFGGEISLNDLTHEDLFFATRLIKYAMVYGADFRSESLSPVDSDLETWSMEVSHSRDLFGENDPHEDVHYVLPREGTMIEVDALAMIMDRPADIGKAADLFLAYLLWKPVAASLTIFSHRANLVPGSAGFVPREMVSSPVYTLPRRDQMHFLPHWSQEDVSNEWAAIKEFSQSLASFSAESHP